MCLLVEWFCICGNNRLGGRRMVVLCGLCSFTVWHTICCDAHHKSGGVSNVYVYINVRGTSWLLWWASQRIMSDTVKPHNPQRTTVRLPPRRLFPQMQTIQPESTWCDRRINRNMWSVTSTPPISIGQSYTKASPPTQRLRPSDSVKQTKITCSTWVKHQTEAPIQISGWFALIRMAYW